jgi:hypothetical protein
MIVSVIALSTTDLRYCVDECRRKEGGVGVGETLVTESSITQALLD